jgi:glutamyl-tRNA synthetase
MGELGIDPAAGPDLVDVASQQLERAKTLVEMAEISAFFYRDFDEFEQQAAKKHLKQSALEPLQQLRERLAMLEDWQGAALHQVVIDVSEALDLNMGKVAQPLRVAVAGRAASPGLDVTLELVGREACLRRIDKALAWINKRVEENGS